MIGGILVDTNVLIDVLKRDPRFFAWSDHHLEHTIQQGAAAVNPLILAELAGLFESPDDLTVAVPHTSYRYLDLPCEAAFLAGHAYRDYRRRGGTKTAPLPDFLIGARAQVAGMTLLTRDVRRYRTYFPDVPLISPPEEPQRGAADN